LRDVTPKANSQACHVDVVVDGQRHALQEAMLGTGSVFRALRRLRREPNEALEIGAGQRLVDAASHSWFGGLVVGQIEGERLL
jgi:hypothetical protein